MQQRKFSRLAALALLAPLGMAAAACDDEGSPTDPTINLELVEGLYEVVTITFDPQGSAPAADVLSALEAGGISPTLNIGRTGAFQLFFRDPVSGNIQTLSGSVEAAEDGIRLVFQTQAAADNFLFPRTLPLGFDETEETLSFGGSADVSRTRLQQLFPELYAEEQLFDPTPGFLSVVFSRTDDTTS